jgi:hypothetical protein
MQARTVQSHFTWGFKSHRMGETGHVPPETATDVFDTLEESRDTFLAGPTE